MKQSEVSRKTAVFGRILPQLRPEVYPLVAIMGIALSGVTAFCLYALTKNDVVIDHGAKLPPWERDFNRTTPRKLIQLSSTKVPELSEEVRHLKEEINKEL